MRIGLRALLCCASTLLLLVPAFAPVAGAGENGRLEGRINVEFPAFDRQGSAGCKPSRAGSVSKLKPGNRVRIYRGVMAEEYELDISDKPIATGKVGKGTYNDITGDCDMAFTVKKAPVLGAAEFYVVEVKGISVTQTIPADNVIDGNLGDIPAEI